MLVGNLTLSAQRNVTVTVYNKGRQTADGTVIPWKQVKNRAIRWCAISPNLYKKNGGPYSFGDTIRVENAGGYDGDWVIHDLTSKKHRNWIDLLVPPHVKHGRWNNARITNHRKYKK